jgi:hypothetical protein
LISKVKVAGFPEQILVDNGKRIRNWEHIRKQLDIFSGQLMALAAEMAKQKADNSPVERKADIPKEKGEVVESKGNERVPDIKSDGTGIPSSLFMPCECNGIELHDSDFDWGCEWE